MSTILEKTRTLQLIVVTVIAIATALYSVWSHIDQQYIHRAVMDSLTTSIQTQLSDLKADVSEVRAGVSEVQLRVQQMNCGRNNNPACR